MTRLNSALLLLFFSTSTSYADRPDTEPTTARVAVNQRLTEMLTQEGMARVEIILDLTGDLTAARQHPAADSGVHPAVFDLVMMAGEGPIQLDQAGDFHQLRIALTEPVLGTVLQTEEVLAVYLDTEPPEARSPLAKAAPGCVPTWNRACLQGNANFGISSSYGGVTGRVASAGADSVTFWAYSPNNWEVLAKVLDGCGVNNHWWLFGAAAGTSPYTIGAYVFPPGGTHALGNWGASNKPIVNLQLLSCS